MNVKDYLKGIRRLASQLDPEAAALDAQETEREDRTHLERSQKEIWLISLDKEEVGSKGGQVVSAHPMIAARWMRDQTHELASEHQVAAHKHKLEQKKLDIEKEEADRKGVPSSKIVEMLAQTLAATTANANASASAKSRGEKG